MLEIGELIVKAEKIYAESKVGYRIEVTVLGNAPSGNVLRQSIIYMQDVDQGEIQPQQPDDNATSPPSAQFDDPILPPHPGVWVAQLIKKGPDRTLESFARRCECSRTQIGSIVLGKRSITTKMAKLLGRATNTDPQDWLTMQLAYDAARRS